ncbi:hypothetical protein [Bacillus thuringiensis]|uniref:Uncharacterized protein n=1 Tax=Bacillus thuringiensis TaxID=1428 RepID=A0A9X6VE13_BACTU|nr:hypothetical protein [Bacillus thuringiensis]MEC3273909.1 hypothetical protein [Bacillus thuringiensis]PFB09004.1 hypothetical protein CN398_05010 [Bacillus thuringiensis]
MDEKIKKTLKEIHEVHQKRKKQKENPNKFWNKYEGTIQFLIIFFFTFIVPCIVVYGALHLIEWIKSIIHF